MKRRPKHAESHAENQESQQGAETGKLFYRPAEVQAALGIKTTTFYTLVKSGALETKKLGRATIVPAASLQKLVETLRAQ